MARIHIDEVAILITRKEAKQLKDKISAELTTFVNEILTNEGLQVNEKFIPKHIDELLEIIKDDEGLLKELTRKTQTEEVAILVDVVKIKK